MTPADASRAPDGAAFDSRAAETARGTHDVKDTVTMTETTQSSTNTTTPAPAPAPNGPGAESDLAEDSRDVILELLRQHQALLTELRWAYGQLERVQEVDIAALKQRVSELEQRSPGGKADVPASQTASSKIRKRVEFTLQHPDRAARAAGRKLTKPFGQVTRRAGFNR